MKIMITIIIIIIIIKMIIRFHNGLLLPGWSRKLGNR